MSTNTIKNIVIDGITYTIPAGYNLCSTHKVSSPAMKKAVAKYYETHKEEIKLKAKERAQTPEAIEKRREYQSSRKEQRRIYQNERNRKIREAYEQRLIAEKTLVDTLMSEVLSD